MHSFTVAMLTSGIVFIISLLFIKIEIHLRHQIEGFIVSYSSRVFGISFILNVVAMVTRKQAKMTRISILIRLNMAYFHL